MSVSRLFFGVLTILAVVSSILLSMAHAQSAAPAPAPTSDGKLKMVQYVYTKVLKNIYALKMV